MTGDVATLLAAHAALPEAYQPAWGIEGSRGVARRACDDRLAVILPLLEALPGDGPVRVLDVGCAQGYFTFAIEHALASRGRPCEVVGVDNLAANVDFCRALAAHHGAGAQFLNERFDAAFFARHGGRPWDVVLALNVLHHMQRPDDDVAGAVAAMRRYARLTICELAQREEALAWIGQWHADDAQLLGGFGFRRRVASFPTHLTDVPRPLYVCSDTLAWVGGRWFAFDHVAVRSHAGVPDAFAGQRRFLTGLDVVVKGYRGDGVHGAFNRAELEAEAAVLGELSGDSGRYPSVLGRDDDGDMVWLARGLLPGRLLSACVGGRDAFDRDAVVRGLLGELARLEARGFHHGDLRCWNVLLHGREIRLIDFGAMTHEASPLQRVALAAMLLEVAEGRLRHVQSFYASLHPLTAYPARWHALLKYLLETPQSGFHFSAALAAFERAAEPSAVLAPAADVVAAVACEQCEAFQRLEEHAAEAARHASALDQQLAAAARERQTLDAARREADGYVTSLRATVEACHQSESEAARHVESLESALAESHAYAEALQARVTRESADAANERAAFDAARRDAESYATSLAKALAESRTYATSLAKALAESRAYADALQARVTRESADAANERAAFDASRRESETYAKSLRDALDDARCAADAGRRALTLRLQQSEARHARMQRRFRLLKFLWPREPEAPKEAE